MDRGLPLVSFIVPCRNEAPHLARNVGALVAQDYPTDRLEIIVADGESEDGSADIARALLSDAPQHAVVVSNPDRTTPTGLNIALKHARGDIVIVVIAHAELAADYVRRAVELLASTDADCVGGPIHTHGHTRAGKAIALALSSFVGVGGVAFRTRPGYRGFADTAAFAAYRKEVFDRIGGFDPAFHRNVDSEFNFRLTRSGGRVWLDPALRSTYQSRETFRALWRQYFYTGASKVLILTKHGRMPAWRHYVPGAFVATLAGAVATAAALRSPLVAAVVAVPYAAAVLIGSVLAVKRRVHLFPLTVMAMLTLHFSYGVGFLVGLWRALRRRSRDGSVVHEALPRRSRRS
jgi:succinoglycan biosynthesis protein ExoA